MCKIDQFERMFHPVFQLWFGHLPAAKPECNIFENAQMREKCIVLEYQTDIAPMRRFKGNVPVSQSHRAFIRLNEACQHAQRRGLAAA